MKLDFLPGAALPRRAFPFVVILLACIGALAPLAAQTAHFSYAIQTMGGGFTGPSAVAVDANGNVYMADVGDSTVKEITAGCGAASCSKPLGGGFNSPQSLALDSSGNVYVADTGNNAIKEIPVGCVSASCVVTLGGNFDGPMGVAYAAAYVWVSDTQHNVVKRMLTTCKSSSCVATKVSVPAPHGIAIDPANPGTLLYVATGTTVQMMTQSCVYPNPCTYVPTTLGVFSNPYGIALKGNTIYVADYGDNSVKLTFPACGAVGCVIPFATGFNGPSGVAADSSGNVYVADTYNAAVKQIAPGTMDLVNRHVNQTSGGASFIFAFDSPGQIQVPKILNDSPGGTDYTDAGTGTCNTNGLSHSYAQGDTCTVDITFAPKGARLRFGAVSLANSSGVTIATDGVEGRGFAPEISISSPATITTPDLGLGYPIGIALDNGGNAFISVPTDDHVDEVPAGCSSAACVKTVGGGFYYPAGLTVDASGNVYLDDANHGAFKMVPAGCSTAACVVTMNGGVIPSYGGYAPVSDANGHIYVAASAEGGAELYQVPAGCASPACPVDLGSFYRGESLAVDSRDNFYFSQSYGAAAFEQPNGWSQGQYEGPVTLAPSTALLAVDGGGNLYNGSANGTTLQEIPPGCDSLACVTNVISLNAEEAIAVDSTGANIFVSSFPPPPYTGGAVFMEIHRSVPASLSFTPTSVGSQSTDSPQLVTVKNIGTVTLTLPPPTSGTNPTLSSGFSLDASTTCPILTPSSAAATLAVGASCTYAVDSKPTAGGAYTGSLVLTDNSLNPASGYVTQTVQLSGFGVFPPSMTSPVKAATLSGSNVTFTWNPGDGVQAFKLKVGTTGHGSHDVYNGTPTTSTSVAVSNIPTSGVTLYVRLYYEIDSVWEYLDYTYTEAGGITPPALTTPAPGSKLKASSVVFTWTPGYGPTSYKFKVGTTGHGSYDIYNGTATTSTSAAVSNIPAIGVLLYVRLYYEINAVWNYIDYSYTEAGAPTPPAITTPIPGSTLVSSSVTFNWSPGAGPSAYQLKVGDTGVGSSDIYSGGSITGTSATVANVPTAGKKLYVRLLYELGQNWAYVDYTYTEK